MVEKTRMTSAEFLELPEQQGIVELIDGEIVTSPAPTEWHAGVVMAVIFFLKDIIPDGVLRTAPVDVKFDDDYTVQPDVFWVSDKNTHCHHVDGKYWQGAPDLIVEVLSPSTAKIDFGHKFDLYEKHGVREYWLLDPDARFAQVFTLRDGAFARVGVFGDDEVFQSALFADVDIPVAKLLG